MGQFEPRWVEIWVEIWVENDFHGNKKGTREISQVPVFIMVAGAGLEPTTFGL